MIGFDDLPRLPGIGGIIDTTCPLCSAARKKKRLKCLRVWRPEAGWLTFHCVHCGEHGYAFEDGIERQIDHATIERLRLARELRDDLELDRRIRLAANTYGKGVAAHPMIEAYFGSRGLQIPAAARRQLRFDPACIFAEGIHGAILMPFRDFDSYKFTGVHKIAVDSQGHGLRVDGKKLKKSQGRVQGSAMMWSRAASKLTICEGLETAFAVIMEGLNEGSPVWAFSGTSFIEQFYPGVGDPVRHLIIAADHDEAGIRAADRCARNWKERAMVDLDWPLVKDTDFATRFGS